MGDIDEQMQQLREEYRRDLAPRIDALEQHLLRLIDDGFPHAAFEEFLRLIHNLAGSSGLFGLAGLQAAARDLEAAVATHVEADTRPDAADVGRIRHGLANLRQSLERSPFPWPRK